MWFPCGFATRVTLTRVAGRLGCTLLTDNTISTVHSNSPAHRAGLRHGDIIVAVNGVHVGPDNGAVQALKDQPGSKLELMFVRKKSEAGSSSDNSSGNARKRQRPVRLETPCSTLKSRPGPGASRRSKSTKLNGHNRPSPHDRACDSSAQESWSRSSGSEAAQSEVEASHAHLLTVLESPGVDLRADLLARCAPRKRTFLWEVDCWLPFSGKGGSTTNVSLLFSIDSSLAILIRCLSC